MPPGELREAMTVGPDGVSARSILEAAKRYGMTGRGVRVSIDDLADLPRGSILHWDFAHFVVLDTVTRRGARVLDPARGRRALSRVQLDRGLTGIALIFRPTEQFTPRKPGTSRVWSYLGALLGDRSLLGRVLAMSGLLQVLGMALPAVTGIIVDQVVPRADLDLLWVVAAGAAVAVCFSTVASLIRSHLLIALRTSLDMRMTASFVRHLASLPFDYFQRRTSGDLMTRVNANALVREFLTSSVLEALIDGTLVTLYLVLIAIASPSLALLAASLGLLRVLLLGTVHRRLRELMANQLEAQAQAQSYLLQMFAGIETLKLAGAEARAVERWSNLYGNELVEAARRSRLSAWTHGALHAISTASPLLVLGWGAALVLRGDLSLGAMLALGAFAVAFFTPLSALVESGLKLSTIGGYLERMDDVLQTASDREAGSVCHRIRLSGAICARDLSFRYGPDRPPAVDGVNLEIQPGQTVAIVGPSGSGKSTLARLLLGLYAPSRGEVLIDGVDIRRLDPESVRGQIGVVPQHPYLFASRVRDNIALSDPTASLARVVRAGRLARIHADIARLPLQYDTPLADRGESLSGGQRQRIAIARALLQNPALLLLDEATSALDAVTEAEVTENLSRLACTRIVIAHRLSTIASADVIVVMNEGRVVEVGRHEELWMRGQHYRELVGAQSTALAAE